MSTLTRHSDRISRDQLGWRWICGRRDEREMKKERRKEGKKDRRRRNSGIETSHVCSSRALSERAENEAVQQEYSRNTAGIQQTETDRQTDSFRLVLTVPGQVDACMAQQQVKYGRFRPGQRDCLYTQ